MRGVAMRFLVGVTSAFAAGGLIGVALGIILTEDKYRSEYRASAESYRRAMELARDGVKPEAPVETEEELEVEEKVPNTSVEEIAVVTGDIQPYKPADTNPYHTAVNAKDTPVELFVSGGVNDYGISYIEEEEYQEDDGRFKGQITIVMDEHNPTFFMDGVSITDWDERVGDSILVDFYKLVPPNVPPVLYVRNHKTDEDYEVIRELP